MLIVAGGFASSTDANLALAAITLGGKMKKLVIGSMLVSLMIGSLLVAGPAYAGDDDVERNGSCSGATDWKLKLGSENGGIEVEFEVDQNVNGDKWRVTMKHDGDRFFSGKRETKGPSGSFEVRRVVNNAGGQDKITARARNLSTDEVCRGSAKF